jgi:hypothetical protein
VQGFFSLLWEALKDFTLRILLGCSVISIIVNVAFSDPSHRNIAWIEGFAIFLAVIVCSSVAAFNDYRKGLQF